MSQEGLRSYLGFQKLMFLRVSQFWKIQVPIALNLSLKKISYFFLHLKRFQVFPGNSFLISTIDKFFTVEKKLKYTHVFCVCFRRSIVLISFCFVYRNSHKALSVFDWSVIFVKRNLQEMVVFVDGSYFENFSFGLTKTFLLKKKKMQGLFRGKTKKEARTFSLKKESGLNCRK